MSTDVGDVTADVRRLFEELARQRPDRRQADRRRVPAAARRVRDPGRPRPGRSTCPASRPANIRILVKAGVVIVAGEKDRPEPGLQGSASYHLVERDFGRFARAVRIHVAVDAARATATLRDGELRIVLPKIAERRGRGICWCRSRRSRRREAALHRRHRRPPGPRAGEGRRAGAGRPLRRGLRDRQRRERRGGLRHHPRARRAALRYRRRRADVGQSHLGQEGGARLHPGSSRGCCARPTTPPARPAPARSWPPPPTACGSASST